MRLYDDLASWWPLLSAPEDYVEEADFFGRHLIAACQGLARSLLELGSGGGNNASHMKRLFDRVTLVDLSPGMLEVSQKLNPDCEHVQGDMRTVRLGKQFDCVFVHDAVQYMTTESDLREAIETAAIHCRAGGAVLFAPDHVTETFRPSTDHGGHDDGPRGLRYLEWTWDPDPDDTSYVTDYVCLLRDADGSARVVHDRHIEGLFPRGTWVRLLDEAGFLPTVVPFDHSELEPGTYESSSVDDVETVSKRATPPAECHSRPLAIRSWSQEFADLPMPRRIAPFLTFIVVLTCAVAAWGPQAQETVPGDLKPLLAAPQSEMRMVVQRYTLDRTTLAGNYANAAARGGGGRRGRANADQPPTPLVPVSPARIARLKRFDANWQAALGRVDASRLSPEAKSDLAKLSATIAGNSAQLDEDAKTLAQVLTVAPFAPTIVRLVEARIRVEDMNAQRAAATITEVTKEIARLMAAPPRVNPDQAVLGATAVEQLRALTNEWFTFYNGYDPLFTWWMGVPHAKVDDAMKGYASLLREKIGAENLSVPISAAAMPPIAVGAQPPYPDVPDLNEIIGLPQDEMRDIVARFTGGGTGRGGGNDPRDPAFYTAWLSALKSLEFDKLSRNAQVDYLFIRRSAETQIARASLKLDPNPPRKADSTGIPGPARGREGLLQDLSEAMIPYTPEELIALAEKEFAWCDREMIKASREMGLDDWKKAVEKTKDAAVAPGDQPRMIRDLLYEAIDFLRANKLITVPQVAAESLHMIMMTPERQLVNPFFTGGSQISVSYPTNTMDYEARIQSMRGNNPGFSHATAFHEMIPGHNLVAYMSARFNDYRANLTGGGAFFGEGWPLYWELTLYDMGFNKTPEQRVGALFWRMHRCARIIFSLKFHMGQWSPREAIDFLVERVGHERDNATAEVRRSFDPAAGYGPLYQAAYLLGGLQLRGLRQELVDRRVLTDLQFHDEIMRQGSMPIALLRLALDRRIRLTRDMNIDWKFYGELTPQSLAAPAR